MTNDSRDLDCACAEAMGWTKVCKLVVPYSGSEWRQLHGIAPNSVTGELQTVYHYSTDPSTQAEKLRWLRACDFRFVEITGWDDGTWVAKGFGSPDHHLDREEQGATIDEALARLICCISRKTK